MYNNNDLINTMTQSRIKEILKSINNVKIAIYGDFCLDSYWTMSSPRSDISLESGLNAETVSKQVHSLGGAGNVFSNVAALQPKALKAIGVIGNDIQGRELISQLNKLSADFSGLTIQEDDFITYTYIKKYYRENEDSRINFGLFNKRSIETDRKILKSIRFALENYDALIFNQQIVGSITNQLFIDEINELFEQFNDSIIVLDSRHYSDKIKNVYRKSNEVELAVLNGVDAKPTDFIPLEEIKRYGVKLYNQYNKPIFTTCGARGVIIFDENGVSEIRGIHLRSKLDTVGAGDTFISALTSCLAAGVSSIEAAEFANFASAVTVQKLQTTGTASGKDILAINKETNYSPNI